MLKEITAYELVGLFDSYNSLLCKISHSVYVLQESVVLGALNIRLLGLVLNKKHSAVCSYN